MISYCDPLENILTYSNFFFADKTPLNLKFVSSNTPFIAKIENINSIDDLPNSEELMAAGLIDNRVDSSIFGTAKFAEQDKDKVEKNSYTNIDDMINDTLEKKE